jgi:hypothetical protein
MVTHPFTHSLIHSPTYSLTHSHAYPLTHPLIHSPTCSLTHSHAYPLTHLLTHSFTHPLTRSLTHPLTHSLTHSLTRSLYRVDTNVRHILTYSVLLSVVISSQEHVRIVKPAKQAVAEGHNTSRSNLPCTYTEQNRTEQNNVSKFVNTRYRQNGH